MEVDYRRARETLLEGPEAKTCNGTPYGIRRHCKPPGRADISSGLAGLSPNLSHTLISRTGPARRVNPSSASPGRHHDAFGVTEFGPARCCELMG